MDIIIIGTGPAGLMCASEACKNVNNNITILDGNEKIGKKLYITGKGRCNVCNDSSKDEFLKNVVTNSKFLYTSINNFCADDTKQFFVKNGTPLKVERGNRVFPVSDKASDISKTFAKVLKVNNVKIFLNQLVTSIKKFNDKFKVLTKDKSYSADCVVVATGGKSYPQTGSTGDGYRFAKLFGHNVNKVLPALVPIILKDNLPSLSGLSLKNVKASIKIKNKQFSEQGEMLFTHTGVSGPIILTLSSYVNKFDVRDAILSIDLKPALSFETLDNRLIRDFGEFKTKNLKNYLKELLPSSLIPVFLKYLTSINDDTKVCNISKTSRQEIVSLLKNFSFKIDRLDDISHGIVTSGGVDVKQINPKNMESKLVKGLFFVGEVLDVDALTGGFNIQIALSTGYSAGKYLKNLESSED